MVYMYLVLFYMYEIIYILCIVLEDLCVLEKLKSNQQFNVR